MGVQFYKKQEKLLTGPLEESLYDFLNLKKEHMHY